MNRESLLQFCRKLPHATEDIKWGCDLVFSIGGKMFAVFDLNDTVKVSFKAAPANFALLTTKAGVIPAPYLARANWIALVKAKALPVAVIKQLLQESYHLVAAKLPAKVKKELRLIESSPQNVIL